MMILERYSHDVYTSVSLKFALKHRKRFDVDISLIVDGLPNAYLYAHENLVSLGSIFGKWYEVLNSIKKEYPKNKLIKHLMSSCWGNLQKPSKTYHTAEELQQMDMTTVEIIDKKFYATKELYVIVQNDKYFKYNLRLKSWITAYGRNKTADVALLDIDNVIRVHTDGIVFKKKQDFDILNLIPEDKTTGKIHWKNVNTYEKV